MFPMTSIGNRNSIILSLKKDRVQDFKITQLNFQVHDTYKKVEKLTTKFKGVDKSEVINKAYLDKKNLIKRDDHLSFLEKDYHEFK